MIENSKDRKPRIYDDLIKEFAIALKDNKFDLEQCITPEGYATERSVDEMLEKMKFRYDWGKIKAQVYAAIISRSSAMMNNAKGQRYVDEDLEWSDVRRGVSKRVLEDCLDIVCHNVNVLDANSAIMYDGHHDYHYVEKAFVKYGIPQIMFKWDREKTPRKSYIVASKAYVCWASYNTEKSPLGEKYVCNSDNGPQQIVDILNNCPYNADEIDMTVTLNKCLDVVHFRGNLAGAFVEDGQQTCAMVSNLPNEIVV